jgi:hypothetical protein
MAKIRLGMSRDTCKGHRGQPVVGNVDPQMPPRDFRVSARENSDEKSSLPLQMESGGPKSGGISRGIRLARQDKRILLYQLYQ